MKGSNHIVLAVEDTKQASAQLPSLKAKTLL